MATAYGDSGGQEGRARNSDGSASDRSKCRPDWTSNMAARHETGGGISDTSICISEG